jgi:capsid portal protein
MQIQKILAERGNNYGEFEQHARITQAMKDAMKDESLGKYTELQDYMKEALEMICHKIGRIVNGNPYYIDSWVDIVGYAQLVIDQIEKDTNGN